MQLTKRIHHNIVSAGTIATAPTWSRRFNINIPDPRDAGACLFDGLISNQLITDAVRTIA